MTKLWVLEPIMWPRIAQHTYRTAKMTKRLLLIDYENVPRVDLSDLDETYRAIVFVGASRWTQRKAPA